MGQLRAILSIVSLLLRVSHVYLLFSERPTPADILACRYLRHSLCLALIGDTGIISTYMDMVSLRCALYANAETDHNVRSMARSVGVDTRPAAPHLSYLGAATIHAQLEGKQRRKQIERNKWRLSMISAFCSHDFRSSLYEKVKINETHMTMNTVFVQVDSPLTPVPFLNNAPSISAT